MVGSKVLFVKSLFDDFQDNNNPFKIIRKKI